MEGNVVFRLFYEVQYQQTKSLLDPVFSASVHDASALHICSFILSILHQGIFSVSAFIVSVIYLLRFKEASHITLHACTWRPLFITALLIADKMWEDKPVRNSSLAKLFPALSNLELNRMENRFLHGIKFNVLVKPDLFCSFCEKLLAESFAPEVIQCVSQSEYAQTLNVDQPAQQKEEKSNGNHQVVPSVQPAAPESRAVPAQAIAAAQETEVPQAEPRPRPAANLALGSRAQPAVRAQSAGPGPTARRGLEAARDGAVRVDTRLTEPSGPGAVPAHAGTALSA